MRLCRLIRTIHWWWALFLSLQDSCGCLTWKNVLPISMCIIHDEKTLWVKWESYRSQTQYIIVRQRCHYYDPTAVALSATDLLHLTRVNDTVQSVTWSNMVYTTVNVSCRWTPTVAFVFDWHMCHRRTNWQMEEDKDRRKQDSQVAPDVNVYSTRDYTSYKGTETPRAHTA